MSASRRVIPIDPNFFCDGHYYVLTSASLGGSELEPEALANQLAQADAADIEILLRQGICIPLYFDGDCALDTHTLFVLGELTEPQAHDWIGRLAWKLKIPCGKLVLLCGGGDGEELAYAISGKPPQPNYQIFQTIEVPPGDYLVEIYAYLSSMTVQLSLESWDQNWNLQRNDTLSQWYEENQPGSVDVAYIIRLSPLSTEPPFPPLVAEIGWCGEFEFRQPNR